MKALDQLVSVLCDPAGKCCIHGSEADRQIVDSALAALRTELSAAQAEPARCEYCDGAGGAYNDEGGWSLCHCQDEPAAQAEPVQPISGEVTDAEVKRAFPFAIGWNHSDKDLKRYRYALEVFLSNRLAATPTKPDVKDIEDRVLSEVVDMLSKQHSWLTNIAATNLVAGLYGRANKVFAAIASTKPSEGKP